MVVEEVLEEVMFDVEPGVRCVVTDFTVKGSDLLMKPESAEGTAERPCAEAGQDG